MTDIGDALTGKPLLMDIATLSKNLCLSVSTIEDRVKKKQFPQPIRKYGKRLWVTADVYKDATKPEDGDAIIGEEIRAKTLRAFGRDD
jgi:predicted DNA-binding transcriptional regulator AlpA